MQNSFSVVFETENVKREVHLPTVRMVSPTHMSAAGVSLEVNMDTVWFSSEEFRAIDSSLFLMGLTVESVKCLMQQRVHTESVFYTGGCRHGNFWHALNPPHAFYTECGGTCDPMQKGKLNSLEGRRGLCAGMYEVPELMSDVSMRKNND